MCVSLLKWSCPKVWGARWHLKKFNTFVPSYYARMHSCHNMYVLDSYNHGLRPPREEIAFTARPKTQSQSQIFRYGGSIFCLPHRPNFSENFDLCLHWVSVVRGYNSFDFALLHISWIMNWRTKSNMIYLK